MLLAPILTAVVWMPGLRKTNSGQCIAPQHGISPNGPEDDVLMRVDDGGLLFDNVILSKLDGRVSNDDRIRMDNAASADCYAPLYGSIRRYDCSVVDIDDV